VTIVYGGFCLLVTLAAIGELGSLPYNGGLETRTKIAIQVTLVVMTAISALLLVGGIGVFQRKPWGKTLSLVMGFLVGIEAIYVLLTGGQDGIFQAVLKIGYAVFVSLVLLNRTYAAEFDSFGAPSRRIHHPLRRFQAPGSPAHRNGSLPGRNLRSSVHSGRRV
jgi:hypothetical protein